MNPGYPDYRLTGAITETGEQQTIPLDDWFTVDVPRKELKEFYRRSDAKALRHLGLWLGLLVASGIGAFLTWGSWWSFPFFSVYGVLYAASNSRAHELSHGTAFKSRRINEIFYHLTSFMTFQEGFYFRWSHTRHHSHTLRVGRDPEFQAPRPPNLFLLATNVFFIGAAWSLISTTFNHAFGQIDEQSRQFVPDSDRNKIVRVARIYVALYLGLVAWCVAIGSIMPAMFVVLPGLYGAAFTFLFNHTQHLGLPEDVQDHRLNCRTVMLNPVFAFLYMNMNYHVEHHMFPMVPFYNLPAFHERIKFDCPPAYRGLTDTYAEIIPALLKQRRNPDYFVWRELPEHHVAQQGTLLHG